MAMNKSIENNRWTAPADQFAVQVQIPDAEGFLTRRLIIDPGTKALFIEDGQFLGEVPPGDYDLQSLAERLKFWRRKRTTVILARQEDVPLRIASGSVPTAENLLVDLEVFFTVQMEDVSLFLHNLLGTRPSYSIAELCQAVTPMIRQAIWEAVGRLPIEQLARPQTRGDIDAAMEQALGLSMRRYGLRFGQVHMVSVRHDQYDQQRRKRGEIWLYRDRIEQAKAVDELQADDRLRQIRQGEKTNELELLAQQVAADRLEGDLSVLTRRLGIRQQWRDAVRCDKFDAIRDETALAQMLAERDKSGLVRQEEIDECKAIFQAKKEDREAARAYLLRKIDIERQVELDQLRAGLAHAVKLKAMEQEMELARTVANEQNRRWLEGLEQQRHKAEFDREERAREVRKLRDMATAENLARREEDWQNLLHQQRADRLQGEIVLVQAERQARVERIEMDLRLTRQREDLALEQRRKQFEQELATKTSQDQMEKLRAMQQANAEFQRQQHELYERRTRLDAELADARTDKAAEHELARLRLLKDANVETLIVAADLEHATLLANHEQVKAQVDLEKHKATEQARQAAGQNAIDERLAQMQAAHSEASKAEQAQLYQQMLQSQQAGMERVAQAYREAMQGQQQVGQQALGTLGQMGQQAFGAMGQMGQPSAAPATPPAQWTPVQYVAPVPGVPAGPGPAAPGVPAPGPVVICTKCRAENPKTARYCSNCGGQL
jgi:hypothetical protein